MAKLVGAAFIPALLIALEGVASADDPAIGPSYGWQTLTVDASAVAITLVGVGLQSGGGDGKAGAWTSGVGIASYAISAPIVHIAHGRPGAALTSGLLRLLGVPVCVFVGAGVGALADRENQFAGLLYGAIGGGGLGAATISIVDATVLAHDDAPPAPRPDAGAVRIVPTFAVGQGSGALGLAGSF